VFPNPHVVSVIVIAFPRVPIKGTVNVPTRNDEVIWLGYVRIVFGPSVIVSVATPAEQRTEKS
jgi:hypothetical protein